jgi:hypothetical protein
MENKPNNIVKNMIKQNINILSGCGTQSDTKQKQEETLPVGEFMSPEANSSPLAWVGSSQKNTD